MSDQAIDITANIELFDSFLSVAIVDRHGVYIKVNSIKLIP